MGLMALLRLKRFWLILLIPFTAGLLELAERFPQAVERYYSRGIYPVLAAIFGRISSIFPFSLMNVAAILVFPVLIFLILRHLHRRKLQSPSIRPKSPLPNLISWFATLCGAAGILYLLFALVSGLNYQRLSFASQSGLEVHPSSPQELAALTRSLVESATQLRAGLPLDENGIVKLSASPYQLARQAQEYYPALGERYPHLGGFAARPKPALFSWVMSHMQISGVYVVYLFEPNVNVDAVDFYIPVTMMHEISHFKGYMREEDANFLAYLACKYSDSPEFRYSGTMLALMHSTNALYSTNKDLYWEVSAQLSPGVRDDLAANSRFWQQYEGPVAQVSTAVNDAYLKSNRQTNGVKSYGAMVDLLLAEYRQDHPGES